MKMPLFLRISKKPIIAPLIFCLIFAGFPVTIPGLAYAQTPALPEIRKTVYLLEDAHDSLSAQEQIADRITRLRAERGIELVGTEGAEGELDASSIKNLAPAEHVTEAARKFLKEGYIGGAEFAYLKGRLPVRLIGVEESAIYKKDLELYRELIARQADSASVLKRLEALLNENMSRKSQRELTETGRLLEDVSKENFSFLNWFEKIDPMLRWKRIIIPKDSAYLSLRQIVRLSKNSDEKEFVREWEALKKEMAALAAPDERVFLSRNENSSIPRLLDLAARYGINLSAYPEVLRKGLILSVLGQLKTRSLYDEMQSLVWKLRLAFADTEAERGRVHLAWHLNLIRKMCRGEMTASDLEALAEMNQKGGFESQYTAFVKKNNPGNLGKAAALLGELNPVLNLAQEFYELAELRSNLMARRLLDEMEKRSEREAVLVSGGFHSRQLERYLGAQGVEMKRWTPLFDEADAKIPYQQRILAPLEARMMRQAGESPIAASPARAQIRNEAFAGDIGLFETVMAEELGIERDTAETLDETLSAARGKSLGAVQLQDTFAIPATNPGNAFKGVLEGKNPLHQKNPRVPVFGSRENDRVWILEPVWRRYPAKVIIREMFGDPLIGREIASGYEKLVRHFYLKTDGGEFYPDLLMFAMERTFADIDAVNAGDFLKKKAAILASLEAGKEPLKTEEGVMLTGFDAKGRLRFFADETAWEKFWENASLAQYFIRKLGREKFEAEEFTVKIPYQAGQMLEPLLDEEVEKRKETAGLRSALRHDSKLTGLKPLETIEDLELNVRTGKPAQGAGKIWAVFRKLEADQKPREAELKQTLDDMEAMLGNWKKSSGEISEARSLYAGRPSVLKDKNSLLKELLTRERQVTLGALERILRQHGRAHAERTDELVFQNDSDQFMASPSAGLFEIGKDGEIRNWNEVLGAYIKNLAPKMRYLMSKLGGEDFAPDKGKTGNQYEDLMRLAWRLYFPAAGGWQSQYSVFPVEDEMGQITEAYQFNAFWIRRVNLPLNRSEAESDYVIVGPKSHVSVTPFLKLSNPTEDYQLFRVTAPRTGREKAVLVTDPYEKAMVGGAFVSGALSVQDGAPLLYDRRTGLPEVDQIDPVRKIEGLREQIENLTGARLIHAGEKNTILAVPGMEEIFTAETVSARKIIPKESRDVWALRAAEGVFKSRAPLSGDEVKDAADTMSAIASRAALQPEGSVKNNGTQLTFDPANGITVRFTSGSGITLGENTVGFILQGKEGGESFRREELLGFQGTGLYLVLAALKFLESQRLSGQAEMIYRSWRPYLLELYRGNQAEIKGKSLGQLIPLKRPEIAPLAPTNPFFEAERFSALRSLVNQVLAGQEGPYELLVYWPALKKGILFPDLDELLNNIPGLKITLVDDHMTGEEIYQELKRRDPKDILRSHQTSRRLVIPKNPKLGIQLGEARERLESTYKNYYDSFLGVVFSDSDEGRQISAREMVSKAPKGFRFVARGNLDLGVVSHAAMALIRGTPQDMFNQRYQDEEIWGLTSLLPAELEAILSRYSEQILLQTSA